MATANEKRLFDILNDLIATAEVLTEQVAQIKRNHHLVDHQADNLAEMYQDDNGRLLINDGEGPPASDPGWWNDRRMTRIADGFVEAA